MTNTIKNELVNAIDSMLTDSRRIELLTVFKSGKPMKFAPMGEILSELCSDDLYSIDFNMPQLYVVTNSTSMNGFSTIFYPKFLDTLASEVGRFFILPSSLHEALIVPEALGTDVESLYQMVCEIDKTQVAPADRLTDNVYWYDADKKQLMAYA